MPITPEPTRADVGQLAYRAGYLSAHVGDFYDLVEALARGYSAGARTSPEDLESSPAYTGPGQAGGELAVAGGPNSTAAQERPAPDSAHALRCELIALDALIAAAKTVLEWRVDDAREAGWTWEAIGEPLDLTKTGAHAKFKARKQSYKEISGDILPGL